MGFNNSIFSVIKNLTIVERIKVLEKKLEKEGYFGEEEYKKAYEAEVAEGKKPFSLVDITSLTKTVDGVKVSDEAGLQFRNAKSQNCEKFRSAANTISGALDEEKLKKLNNRQRQWYMDTFKKWKKLCHANFELLKKSEQAAVVDFCPQADRVRKVFYPCGMNDQ
jgi:hypothetical protein